MALDGLVRRGNSRGCVGRSCLVLLARSTGILGDVQNSATSGDRGDCRPVSFLRISPHLLRSSFWHQQLCVDQGRCVLCRSRTHFRTGWGARLQLHAKQEGSQRYEARTEPERTAAPRQTARRARRSMLCNCELPADGSVAPARATTRPMVTRSGPRVPAHFWPHFAGLPQRPHDLSVAAIDLKPSLQPGE